MVGVGLVFQVAQLQDRAVSELPLMRPDLVLGVGVGVAEDDTRPVNDLIQLRVGASYQDALPMLAVGIDIGEVVAQQKLRLTTATRPTEKQLVHERSADRLFLGSRLRSPRRQ